MISNSKRTKDITLGAFSLLCLVLSDSCFNVYGWIGESTLKGMPILANIDINGLNISITKFLFLIVIYLVVTLLYSVYIRFINGVTLYGDNYVVSIEYGDLFKQKDCKRIISFDECYTTKLGKAPDEIQETSICGQYLKEHPEINIANLLKKADINPERKKSTYKHKERYESGTIVPNGDDLLMAFVKLDSKGRGRLTRKEYIDCLFKMWEEIDLYKGEKDVCIPILGAGVTHFDSSSGVPISQQELLKIMLMTYQLSPFKVKSPQKLRIIYRKQEGFDPKKVDLNFKDCDTHLEVKKS